PAVRFPLMVMAGQAYEPARLTVRTLPAVLAIASVANLPPAASGRKPTATEVDSPPASAVVPGTPTLKSPALAPLMVNGVASVTGDDSLFVIVTKLVAEVPVSSEPKSIDVGSTVMPGVADPLSGTTTPPPLLVTLTLAALGPALAGVNVTWNVVDAPAASELAAGIPMVKSPAFDPAGVNGGVSVTAAAAMLVTVTVATLLAPAGSDPKFSDV